MKILQNRWITTRQWMVLQRSILHNCVVMLKFLQQVIGTPKNPKYLYDELYMSTICLSIYSHAVEEYGKFLYLKRLKPDELGNVEIEYRKKFRDHPIKFSFVQQELPRLTKLDNIVDEKTFDLVWEHRLNILNTDIDEKGNFTDIKYATSMDVLRNVVDELFEKLIDEDKKWLSSDYLEGPPR